MTARGRAVARSLRQALAVMNERDKIMEAVTSSALWELIKHGYKWLSNLSRAKDERKRQSISALRNVILASTETAVYIRQLNETAKRDHSVESRLSVLWTDLGFALSDLGLNKLAKRCKIKGKHWSDPTYFDQEFLDKADVKLDRMERLANELLFEIEH